MVLIDVWGSNIVIDIHVKYADERITDTGVSDTFAHVINITITQAGLGFDSCWGHLREAPQSPKSSLRGGTGVRCRSEVPLRPFART